MAYRCTHCGMRAPKKFRCEITACGFRVGDCYRIPWKIETLAKQARNWLRKMRGTLPAPIVKPEPRAK